MISEPLQPLAVDISMLTTLEKNPRRGEVKAIMRSLERFGQRKPIVALPNGTVIAGNHTLMAARELGWDEIAVTFSDDDPQTAKAFALADNRTGDLGTYDEEILAELLVEVSDDPETLLATGYTPDDVEQLLAALHQPTDDEWGSALGDLPVGDKQPFQQMTFTLHDHQAEVVREAMDRANMMGSYDTPNENKNGNALARICETFLTLER